MTDNISYKTNDLKSLFSQLKKDGVLEFSLHDDKITSDKSTFSAFLKTAIATAPDIFYQFSIKADLLDNEIVKLLSKLDCSIDIPLKGISKNQNYLFDKKFFSKKASLLNSEEITFGFDMDFASKDSVFDSVKNFRDRLDFAFTLYPNHINFCQILKDCPENNLPKPTATFSTQDIKNCKNIAFAVEIFYTKGRSVSWFNSILQSLKMNAPAFFQDFSEWQKINNCSLDDSKFDAENLTHKDIEKMQLNFLELKFEEKNKSQYFKAVSDIVRLNGACSRFFGEGETESLELSYSPEDIFSPVALNLQKFLENVCESPEKVFVNEKFFG